jgi:hypothetical protein
VRCTRDGAEWGEYVTAGDTYDVAPPGRGRGGQYYLRNRRTDGGTFMRPWSYRAAVEQGWLIEEDV